MTFNLKIEKLKTLHDLKNVKRTWRKNNLCGILFTWNQSNYTWKIWYFAKIKKDIRTCARHPVQCWVQSSLVNFKHHQGRLLSSSLGFLRDLNSFDVCTTFTFRNRNVHNASFCIRIVHIGIMYTRWIPTRY